MWMLGHGWYWYAVILRCESRFGKSSFLTCEPGVTITVCQRLQYWNSNLWLSDIHAHCWIVQFPGLGRRSPRGLLRVVVVFEFEGCCLEECDYKRFFLLRHVSIQELALASGQVDRTCIRLKTQWDFPSCHFSKYPLPNCRLPVLQGFFQMLELARVAVAKQVTTITKVTL